MDSRWILIIIAIISAFVFRVAPFAVKNNSLLSNKNGRFYKFLSYSTQGMLGIIVYDALFGQKNIQVLISSFSSLDFIGVSLLVGIFIFVIKTNRMFLALLLSLALYIVLALYLYK